MSMKCRQTLPLAMLLLLGGQRVAAQELGFGVAFKARVGLSQTPKEEPLARRTGGFGFDFGYGWAFGRLSAELGYQYKPGNQYLADLAAMPTAPGASVDARSSVDSRKNQLGGLALRLGYERWLTGSALSLRAGVQVGGAKFRQEYLGDVTNGTTYRDTYNGIATRTTAAVSPYLGLGYDLDAEQRLELNVMALGYTSVNYVHVAGTVASGSGGHTSWDVLQTRKRSVPHLELGYALRF